VEVLAKDDGVSDYSKAWWDAWKTGQAHTDQAMTETIAEMARLKATGRLEPARSDSFRSNWLGNTASTRWMKYYDAIMKTAKENGA
jgi:hypothetical protein